MLVKWYIVEDPSLCWAVSFFTSIIFRHTSHRYFVFGEYSGSYNQSLTKMYTSYSFIVFISTVFNMVMIRRFGIRHYVAWCITLVWTGIVNYLILKKIWGDGNANNGGKGKKEDNNEIEGGGANRGGEETDKNKKDYDEFAKSAFFGLGGEGGERCNFQKKGPSPIALRAGAAAAAA